MTAIVEGILESIEEIRRMYLDDKRQVAARIGAIEVDLDRAEDLLAAPGDLPYGRTVLYQDEYMEVILMNWGSKRSSLPHDHGTSEGWVKVLSGTASHVRYKTGSEPPRAINQEKLAEGQVFYAPRRVVHEMGNPTDDALVTLHFYFPPIEHMEVFDAASARAAIVSSDCGAWWPESPRQLIESRNFGEHYERTPAVADNVS